MKVNKLFLLAMGLVAVGCNDSQIEEQSLINNAQGELVEVEIDATVAPASRATSKVEDVIVNDSTKYTVVDIKFTEGDEIGVYFNSEALGYTQENVKFTAAGKNADTGGMRYTTDEKLMLLANGNTVYAYYPYVATGTSIEGTTTPTTRSSNLGGWDGYHYFSLPAVQEQAGINDHSNLKKYIKLISTEAPVTKVQNNVTINMAFQHAFSYVTLNVQNELEKDVEITEAVIKLFNDGQEVGLVGNLAAALDEEVDGDAVVASNLTSEVKVVPAEGADMTLAAGAKAYITAAVAPVAAFDAYEVLIRTKEGYSYKVAKDLEKDYPIAQGYSRKLSIPLTVDNMTNEVLNSDAAKYMLGLKKKDIVLELGTDIYLDIAQGKEEYMWGNTDVTETITINGNGHKLFFVLKSEKFNDVNLNSWKTTLTINDADLYIKSENTANDQTKDQLAFHCDLVLNNVNTYVPVWVRRNAEFNNVTFNGSKISNTFNLWVLPIKATAETEKQTVKINNCEFRCDGEDRGIKIDGANYHNIEGYGDYEQVPVYLSVSNTKFATEKKAAIMVYAPESDATIEIGEGVDLTDCKADRVNHVWIDSHVAGTSNTDAVDDGTTGYFEYSQHVNVIGGNWKFEKAEWSVNADGSAVAETTTGLAHALEYGKNTIALKDGVEFELPSVATPVNEAGKAQPRAIAISGSEETLLQLASADFEKNSLSISGVKVLPNNNKGVKAAGSATVIYEDVVFTRPMVIRSNNATIKNSVINFNEVGKYLETNTAESVTIEGCIFNSKGSAILVKNPAYAAEVTVTNCYFNASASYAEQSGTVLKQRNCAAIEIDNAGGLAHVVTTSGNKFEDVMHFAGEWRIRNYVEVDGGVTVNGVAYEGMYLDGKMFYQKGEGWYLEE